MKGGAPEPVPTSADVDQRLLVRLIRVAGADSGQLGRAAATFLPRDQQLQISGRLRLLASSIESRGGPVL
jgi:hypothetical protein